MESPFIWESRSPNDTRRFGLLLGKLLPPGLIVALNGELGSGKTQLVRAICEGLGIDTEQVNSPTFVLMQAYPDGRLPVFHFDTYRLGDPDEFLAIGAEDYLHDENALCLIEWAEKVDSVLQRDKLTINIRQTGQETRQFEVNSHGKAGELTVRSLAESILTDEQIDS